MAINYGFSEENAKALLLKLGVDKDVLKSVFAFGWGVKLTASELAFVKDAEKHPVPIDLATMQKLSAGTLSAAALAKISEAAKVTVAQVTDRVSSGRGGGAGRLLRRSQRRKSPDQTSPGLTFADAAEIEAQERACARCGLLADLRSAQAEDGGHRRRCATPR